MRKLGKILAACLVWNLAWAAETAEEKRKLAESVLDNAIERQVLLLRKRSGDENEVRIRLGLAETLHQKADLFARVPTEKPKYRSVLFEETKVLEPVMEMCRTEAKKYCLRASLLRASAYLAVGMPEKAVSDLNYVVKNGGGIPEVDKAQLLLAQIEMEWKKFDEAIVRLSKISDPTKATYPVVMDRLAWAYAGKGLYPQAVHANERIAKWVKNHPAPAGFQPNVVAINAAVFYSRAMESKIPDFTGEKAANYFFETLPEEIAAVAFRNFPSLLTRPDQLQSLHGFGMRLAELDPESKFTQSTTFSIVDRECVERRFDLLQQSLTLFEKRGNRGREFVELLKKIEKNVLSYLNEGGKKDSEITSRILRQVHMIAEKETSVTPLEAAQFDFSFGALEFSEKNYSAAQNHFLAVIESQLPESSEATRLEMDASAKHMQVSYQLVMEHLSGEAKDVERTAVMRALSGWDAGKAAFASVPEAKTMELKIAQALFQMGLRDLALPRLIPLVSAGPSGTDMQVAAQMVLSLYAEQGEWEKVKALAEKIQNQADLDTQLKAMVVKLKDQASYQLVRTAYEGKKFPQVWAMAEVAKESVADQNTAAMIFDLAANAALSIRDVPRATSWLEAMFQKKPLARTRFRMAWLKGAAAEETLYIERAAAGYMSFFSDASGETKDKAWDELRTKAELLATVSSHPKLLKLVGTNAGYCSPAWKTRCERLVHLSQIFDPEATGEATAPSFLGKAAYFVHLQGPTLVELQKMLQAYVKQGVTAADATTAYMNYAAFSAAVPQVRKSFEGWRRELQARFAIVDGKSLTARLRKMKETDPLVELLSKSQSPEFAEVKKAISAQLSIAYREFSSDLGNFRTDDESLRPVVSEMHAKFDALSTEWSPAADTGGDTLLWSDWLAGNTGAFKQAVAQAALSKKWAKVDYFIRLGTSRRWLTAEEKALAERNLSSIILAGGGQ